MVSDIVVSLAGHDKGEIFLVLEEDGDFAYLANGRSRKIENPKRKKVKHLRKAGAAEGRTAEKLRGGETLTNSELRKTLAAFAAADFGEQEVCKHG